MRGWGREILLRCRSHVCCAVLQLELQHNSSCISDATTSAPCTSRVTRPVTRSCLGYRGPAATTASGTPRPAGHVAGAMASAGLPKSATRLELERLRERRQEMAARTDQILATLNQPGPDAPAAAASPGQWSAPRAAQAGVRPDSPLGLLGTSSSGPPAGVPPLAVSQAGTSMSPGEAFPASAPTSAPDPWENAGQLAPMTRERAATTGGGGRLGKLKGGVSRKVSAGGMRVSHGVSSLVGKTPRPAQAAAQQQLLSGWLFKEGDFGMKNEFQKRFFILYTLELQYFKDDPGSTWPWPAPAGGVALASASIADHEASRGQQHCFHIDLAQPDAHLRKRYVLAADSASQKTAWVAELRKAVSVITASEMDEDALMQADHERSMFEGAEMQFGPGSMDSRNLSEMTSYIQSLAPPQPQNQQSRAGGLPGTSSTGNFHRADMLGALVGGSEPEVETVRPEQVEMDSAPLCDVLRKRFSLQGDNVEMAGWLSIVNRQSEKSIARIGKKKNKKRAARQSANDAVGSVEYYAVLSGLELVWYDKHERRGRKRIDSLRLDAGAKISFHPLIGNVVLIPGYALSARAPQKTIEWAFALTFNTHAAKLVPGGGEKEEGGEEEEEAIPNYEVDPAETVLSDPKGSNIRFDAMYNHPSREGRLSLAIEVLQGQRPGKTDREARLFEALSGTAPVHVKLWLRLPAATATPATSNGLRATMRVPGGRSARAYASHQWKRMFETEAVVATEFAPGLRGISFSVLLGIDPWIVLGDGTKLASCDLKIRLGLCNAKEAMLGAFECTVEELQQKKRLVHVLSTAWDAELSDGTSLNSHKVQGDSFSVGSITSDGVILGATAYSIPCKQDVNGNFHNVSMQSYMLRTMKSSETDATPAAAASGGRNRFEDEPLLAPFKNNAVIASEQLVLPKPLSVPIQYLTQAMTSLRKDLLDQMASAGVATTGAVEDSESGDDFDDEDMEDQDAVDEDEPTFDSTGLTTLQLKLKMAIEVLPRYEQCCNFYFELLSKHGQESGVDGTRDLYYKRSTKRKRPEWAFMATNMMMYALELDGLHGGEIQPAPANLGGNDGALGAAASSVDRSTSTPLLWLTTSGASAAHNCKFKKGGVRRLNGDIAKASMRVVQAHQARALALHQALPSADVPPWEQSRPQRTDTKMEGELEAVGNAQEDLVQLLLTKEKRMDCVLSQGISIAAACFFGMFENATRSDPANLSGYHVRWLRLLERTGKFLVHVESLLSTWKNELGASPGTQTNRTTLVVLHELVS